MKTLVAIAMTLLTALVACDSARTVGASTVPTSWPDIKAGDVVKFTLQSISGTPGHPKYTITAGTSFSFTSDAGDFSAYEYEIG